MVFVWWVESFSFYQLDINGLLQYQPDEFIALYHQKESFTLPYARYLSIFRADSGVFIGQARVEDAPSGARVLSLYSDDAVFLQIKPHPSIGPVRFFRNEVSISLSVNKIEMNAPDGYLYSTSTISMAARRGSVSAGRRALVLLNVENDTTGLFGLTVFEDTLLGAGATSFTPNYSTVDEFGSSDGFITDGLYDEAHDCFWVINGGTGGGSVRISRVSTDGAIESTTDWLSSFSISGTSQRITLDDASGYLWLVIGGSAYRWPTWDISATPESFGSGINELPIAWHPYTGTLFAGDDEEGIYTQYRLRAVTGGGADLAEVTKDICDEPGTNLITADRDADELAGITVDGFRLTRVMQRRAALLELQTAYLWDFVPRSGVLTAILRGGTSAATLDDDTLGAHVYGTSPSPRLKISRAPEGSLPKMVGVAFIDAGQDYASGYEYSTRLASEGGTESRVEIGVVLSHDDAAQLADILVHSAHIEAETYEGSAMPSMRSDVVPAGIVTADIDGTQYPMRIDRGSIVDGGIISFNGVRHDASVYSSYMVGGSTRTRTRTVSAPGTTMLVILDIPAVREPDLNSGIYIAGFSYSADWPGAEFFDSADGVSFSPVASVSAEVTTGFLTSALADSDSVNDQTNSISVNLISGSLSSISHDDMQTDKLLNYAAIGAAGRWEIVRFKTASQNADGSWVLTGLERKLRDTPGAAALHAVGDSFVLLETSKLRRIQIQTSEIGSTRYAKAVTIGRLIGQAQARQLTPLGRGLYPFRPACLDANYVTNKWTLTWHRQDKLQARFLQQPQMSESSESYKVDILDLSGSVIRSETTTSETFEYGVGNQINDFGAEVDYLKWRVAQVSSVIGTGPYSYSSSGLFAADYDTQITSRGTLIEFWPMDETLGNTLTSDSGSHNGTYYNAFTLNQAALLIDGSPSVKFTTTGRTDTAAWASLANVKAVEIWIKPDTIPSGPATIINHMNGNGVGVTAGWSLYMQSDGTIGLYVETGDAQVASLTSSTALSAGSIYHVVANFSHSSGGDVELWINGILAASGVTTAAVTLPTTYFMSHSQNYWTGCTAELTAWMAKTALYDTELTQAEIYADALAGFGP